MHAMLLDSAVKEDGEGTPVKIVFNHQVGFASPIIPQYSS